MLLAKHPNAYFLLIADNKFIKLYLSSKQIHRLYIIFNEIGHLGENAQLDRNQIKNTMLDFYLFAHSSMIYAFSSYDHGTGFSFWCAKTYGVPYSCKIIKH
jgi:ADP-heptose:LPS heptosyltransferase